MPQLHFCICCAGGQGAQNGKWLQVLRYSNGEKYGPHYDSVQGEALKVKTRNPPCGDSKSESVQPSASFVVSTDTMCGSNMLNSAAAHMPSPLLLLQGLSPRIATVIMYLNDDATLQGGETAFTQAWHTFMLQQRLDVLLHLWQDIAMSSVEWAQSLQARGFGDIQGLSACAEGFVAVKPRRGKPPPY